MTKSQYILALLEEMDPEKKEKLKGAAVVGGALAGGGLVGHQIMKHKPIKVTHVHDQGTIDTAKEQVKNIHHDVSNATSDAVKHVKKFLKPKTRTYHDPSEAGEGAISSLSKEAHHALKHRTHLALLAPRVHSDKNIYHTSAEKVLKAVKKVHSSVTTDHNYHG